MPFVRVTTNQPLADAAKEALKTGLGQAVAALGKSEAYLMVEVCDERALYFQGTDQPAALVDVSLYGSATDAGYDQFTAEATALVAQTAALPAGRVFVKYAETDHWGMNGRNF